MTEGLDQNQTASSSAPLESAAPVQKVFTQDEVNYLISKVKSDRTSQVAAPQVDKGINISEEKLLELVDRRTEEKLQAAQNQQWAKDLVHQHKQTMAEARKKYDDFDEVVSTINFDNALGIIPLIQAMPNKKDVMYYLGKEDERFNQINSALQCGQLPKAESMMKKFAASIQENEKAAEQAKKSPKAPEPLSQLKPSTTGVGGLNMNVKDLKALLKR